MADYEGRYLHQQFGNYRLVKLLGYGGFAEVYLGEHIHMGTQAAVKVLTAKLTPEKIANFRNEALTVFGLEHPNIVRVLKYDLHDNIPFIVMEYAANGSLRKRHPRGTRVPLPTVIQYVKQIAAALQYAHDEGLVHRDVKPDNMLIDKHNGILLSDFGIVTVSSTVNPEQSQAQTGTWIYMAPEQIMKHPVRASDQYALGITVYEWLCGRPPFEGDWYNLYHQHLNVAPQPLRERVPDIPTAVEQVVMKALAKEPKERYGNMREFADALERAYVSSQEATTLPPKAPPQPPWLVPIVPVQEHPPTFTSPVNPKTASMAARKQQQRPVSPAHLVPVVTDRSRTAYRWQKRTSIMKGVAAFVLGAAGIAVILSINYFLFTVEGNQALSPWSGPGPAQRSGSIVIAGVIESVIFSLVYINNLINDNEPWHSFFLAGLGAEVVVGGVHVVEHSIQFTTNHCA